MQFQLIAVLAGFLAATQALPVSDLKARTGMCGDSSFDNGSSSGSPLISDCQQIARNIAGDGVWSIQAGGQHQLVEYGTCAFGMHGKWAFHIGNQDIIDLINSSIEKFSWEGKVGASGKLTCDTNGDTEWAIYHN